MSDLFGNHIVSFPTRRLIMLISLQAFAVIGTMNFLRVIVALIPFAMRSYGEAKVSFSRIEVMLYHS